MIKVSLLVRRAPHLSHEEFVAYWQDRHAPLAKQHAGAVGMRRYIQVHAVDDPMVGAIQQSRGCLLGDFDGIAEAYFDSLEEMARLGETSAEVGAALLADEQRFVDLPNSVLFVGTVHEVVGPTAS